MKRIIGISAVVMIGALGVWFFLSPPAVKAQGATSETPAALAETTPGPVTLAYDGPGRLFVLDDRRVAVIMDDGSDRALGIEIHSASTIYLAHAGNKFHVESDTISAADKAVRDEPVVLRIPLTADPSVGARSVLDLSGWVQIAQDDEGSWTLLAQDDAGQAFGVTFDLTTREVAGMAKGAHCTATCTGGSCECSGFIFCWCWCDTKGRPQCVGLFPLLFLELSDLTSVPR